MTGNMTENGGENNDSRYPGVGGRHGEVSLVVVMAFKRRWCHTTFRSQ